MKAWHHRDVAVVGGGPAGLAAAIAVRQQGLSVAVVEGDAPPVDKPCGEGLMPDGVEALRSLGVTLDAGAGVELEGIRFRENGRVVDAKFPSGRGIGIRRPALHRVLIERASAAGVELFWKTPVTGLDPRGIRFEGGGIDARWIVGADGGQSLVRQWSNLGDTRFEARRFAFRRHFRCAPWSKFVEIYWGAKGQFYVTPVGRDEICVVLISRDSHLRIDDALPDFPELARRLEGSESTTTERGAVSVACALKRVYRGRVALVGDASGTVDAVSGEGLRLAFHHALDLSAALARNNLELYQLAHRALAKRPLMMTALLLALDRFPRLRYRVLDAFASDPNAFARLLALHVGSLPAARYMRSFAIPLAFQLIRGSAR